MKQQQLKIRHASEAHPLARSPAPPHIRAELPLIVLLAVLLLGPLAAPLFQASGAPLLAGSGALARDLLSRYVCPTPAKSYALLGFPMAVCARCWGATIGMWLAWLLFAHLRAGRRPSALLARYLAWPWLAQLGLAVGMLLLWTLEIQRWPAAPLAALLANGVNGGFWAALFVCACRERLAHRLVAQPDYPRREAQSPLN